MRNLITAWSQTFFVDPANFTCIIITLIVCYSNHNSYRPLKFLPVYLISFIILCLTDYISPFIQPGPQRLFIIKVFRLENFVVTLFELSVFSFYLYSIIKTKIFRRIIAILSISGLTAIILLFCWRLRFNPFLVPAFTLNDIYIIESSVLLLMCSFYFVELFKFPPVVLLARSPDFWICSGLLFYVIVTFPVTIFTTYLMIADPILAKNFYSVVYLSYIILFLSIIQAYRCRRKSAAEQLIPAAE